ncbi:uncharacterized protein TNCV_1419091 [Trichonephila clavipes]|nr:uncharacterized protein TNCV_1419091 [Trichonephila clavipes]
MICRLGLTVREKILEFLSFVYNLHEALDTPIEALHAGRRPLGQPCVGLCGVLGAAHRPALSDSSLSLASARCSLPSPSANHPLAEEWSGAEDADQRSTHRRLIGNTPLMHPLFYRYVVRSDAAPALTQCSLFLSRPPVGLGGGCWGGRVLQLSVGSIF